MLKTVFHFLYAMTILALLAACGVHTVEDRRLDGDANTRVNAAGTEKGPVIPPCPEPEPRVYPAGRLMGYGYWKATNGDLVLAEITGQLRKLPPEGMDNLPNYGLKILTDVRGIFKPGQQIKLAGTFTYGSFSIQLYYKKGDIVLIGVSLQSGDVYDYDSSVLGPVGWSPGCVIPPKNVSAVKAALRNLRSVLPGAVTDPLNHAKAIEFLHAKDFETWAIGVSMLMANPTQADVDLVTSVFHDPKTDFPRALWARCLIPSHAPETLYASNMLSPRDETVAPKVDFPDPYQLGDLLIAFVMKRSPQLCDVPSLTVSEERPNESSSAPNSNPGIRTGAGAIKSPPATMPGDPPAVRLLGRDFWEHDANLIVSKVVVIHQPKAAGDDIRYELEVLADLRQRYKPGAKLTIAGSLRPAGKASGTPVLGKGDVSLFSVQPAADGMLRYDPDGICPLGWRTPRAIPERSVKAVVAAMADLQRLAPKESHGPLDHDKAVELLKSKEYETWALGASMLLAEHANDEYPPPQVLHTEDTTVPEALWVAYLWARQHNQPITTRTHVIYGLDAFLELKSPSYPRIIVPETDGNKSMESNKNSGAKDGER